MHAELQILSGDEIVDIRQIWPMLTLEEKRNFAANNPELMGFWAAVASLATAGIGGIVKAVKKKKAKKKAAAEAKRQAEQAKLILAQQQAAASAAAAKREQEKKMILFGGLGLGALILITSQKRSRQPAYYPPVATSPVRQ